jgi:hypothetical protein
MLLRLTTLRAFLYYIIKFLGWNQGLVLISIKEIKAMKAMRHEGADFMAFLFLKFMRKL